MQASKLGWRAGNDEKPSCFDEKLHRSNSTATQQPYRTAVEGQSGTSGQPVSADEAG